MKSLIIDNFDKVKNVVEWNKNQSYYKFIALLRTKDYDADNLPIILKNKKQEYFIKHWLVDSQEQFEFEVEEMKTIVKMFGCRLYMTTDRKSTMKTLIQSRNTIIAQLDSYLYNNLQVNARIFNKLISSSTQLDESSDRGYRRWLFDIDTKNQYVVNVIKNLVCKDKYLETFETKNGFHIIAKREMDANKILSDTRKLIANFHDTTLLNDLIKNVEIKTNALVLIAMAK